ncbi:TolC family outer membrane protein [Erythrobacter sp.]|uniref:TolC family outer membrane protein n=1 Tax=Erythrobacter sp. TaxID=1042 RepID=UPI003C73509D
MIRPRGLSRAARAAACSGALLLAGCGTAAQADTLREALVQVYNENPTLAAARAQQRATDEEVPIQRAPGLPSASADTRFVEFIRQNTNNFFQPQRVVTVTGNLGVPIYNGGAIKNGIRAAEERVQAGRADLRATESSLFSQAVAAYMDVLRTQALVELSRNQVDVLRVTFESSSDRFEIGDLTITDVAQARSRLALAQSDLRTAFANLVQARETYVQIIGEAPTNLQPPPPLPNLPDTVGIAVVTALDNNPDLIAAKERADAAGFDTEVAGSGRLPTVSLFGTYDYQNTLGTIPDRLVDPDDPSSPLIESPQSATGIQAGVNIRIPLFQGGLPAARQRQAGARESAALEQVIATERDVIAQVRSAYTSWQAALAVIESSQVAVEAAELSLEGVRAGNSIGNRTVLDVLNAEQELLSARAQLVTARRNAYVAGFTLLAAMGKAEARDLNLDTGGPLYDPTVNYERVRDRIWDWDRDPEPVVQSTRTVDIPPSDATIGPVLEPGE